MSESSTRSAELRVCPDCGKPIEQVVEVRTPAGLLVSSRVVPMNCDCVRESKELVRRESEAQRRARECADLRRRWGMEAYAGETFDTFDLERQPSIRGVVGRCHVEAAAYRHPHRDFGLYIYGPTSGTGKSRLVFAAANLISRVNNVPAVAIELMEWLPRLRAMPADERDARVAELCSVPWLGINDAFYETDREHFRLMSELLQARNHGVTWVSSNWEIRVLMAEIPERFADMRLRASRCVDRCARRMNFLRIPDEAISYTRFLVQDRINK